MYLYGIKEHLFEVRGKGFRLLGHIAYRRTGNKASVYADTEDSRGLIALFEYLHTIYKVSKVYLESGWFDITDFKNDNCLENVHFYHTASV